MTTAAEYAYAMTIIARFTRGDYVQWQNVAAVLGRNVEDVKREFDLAMPKPPATLLDEEVRQKGGYPQFRARVLSFLLKGPNTSEVIAHALCHRHESVRARLSELHADGFARHDQAWGRATSRVWQITDEGKSFASDLTSRRSPSKEEVTA